MIRSCLVVTLFGCLLRLSSLGFVPRGRKSVSILVRSCRPLGSALVEQPQKLLFHGFLKYCYHSFRCPVGRWVIRWASKVYVWLPALCRIPKFLGCKCSSFVRYFGMRVSECWNTMRTTFFTQTLLDWRYYQYFIFATKRTNLRIPRQCR